MALGKKRLRNLFGEERRITVYGTNRLVMEGVERIVFCDVEKMILKGDMTITVTGASLCLSELGNGNMAVLGRICSITFEESGK